MLHRLVQGPGDAADQAAGGDQQHRDRDGQQYQKQGAGLTVGPGGLIEDLLAYLQLHRNQIGKPFADRVNGGVQSVHRKCGQCLAIPIPEYLAKRPYFAVCPAYQRLDIGHQCSLPGVEVML